MGPTWTLAGPKLISEGITHRQMSRLLKDAAREAEKMVAKNLARNTFSGRVTAAQLKAAIAGIGPMSTELWTGVGKITTAGMHQAGAMAADQALDLDLMMGVPGQGILQYAHAIHYDAAQAVEDVISRRTSGHTLAERIYAHGKVSTKKVGDIVERNLVLQRSAKDIAREVRDHFHPGVPGGTSFAAMRVGRSEINNAHHDTTRRLGAKKPWVLGMKWNLSGSHPRPDECNDYAEHSEGMGKGVWSDPPGKPHPMCFCYLTHFTEDPQAFMNNLATGQYDGYLEDLGVTC